MKIKKHSKCFVFVLIVCQLLIHNNAFSMEEYDTQGRPVYSNATGNLHRINYSTATSAEIEHAKKIVQEERDCPWVMEKVNEISFKVAKLTPESLKQIERDIQENERKRREKRAKHERKRREKREKQELDKKIAQSASNLNELGILLGSTDSYGKPCWKPLEFVEQRIFDNSYLSQNPENNILQNGDHRITSSLGLVNGLIATHVRDGYFPNDIGNVQNMLSRYPASLYEIIGCLENKLREQEEISTGVDTLLGATCGLMTGTCVIGVLALLYDITTKDRSTLGEQLVPALVQRAAGTITFGGLSYICFSDLLNGIRRKKLLKTLRQDAENAIDGKA